MKFVVNHGKGDRVYNVFFSETLDPVDLYQTGLNKKDANGKRVKVSTETRTTVCEIRVDLSEFSKGSTGYLVGKGKSHCGPKDQFVSVFGKMKSLERAINAAFPVREDRKQAWNAVSQLPGWDKRVGVKSNKKVAVHA